MIVDRFKSKDKSLPKEINISELLSDNRKLRLFLSTAAHYNAQSIEELQKYFSLESRPNDKIFLRRGKLSRKEYISAMFGACPVPMELNKGIKTDDLYAAYDFLNKTMLIWPGNDYNDWGVYDVGRNVAFAYLDINYPNEQMSLDLKAFLCDCAGYMLAKKCGCKISHDTFPYEIPEELLHKSPEEVKQDFDSLLKCCKEISDQVEVHLVIRDFHRVRGYEL